MMHDRSIISISRDSLLFLKLRNVISIDVTGKSRKKLGEGYCPTIKNEKKTKQGTWI